MSKKKHPTPQQSASAPKKRAGSKTLLIAGAIVAVIAVIIWAASSTGAKKVGLGGGATPEEQKYIGRFLPADYQEPKVAGIQAYATTVKMTNVTPAVTETGLSIPAEQIVSKKIVIFDYQKANGETIPLIAYVKPSGKLFVGVSFCPPCEGRGQRIEAGGTLVCESCGTARTLETGVGISGACKLYPLDELPASLVDGSIIVEKAAIEQWTPQPLDRKVGA